MPYVFVLYTLKTRPSGRELARRLVAALGTDKSAPEVSSGTFQVLAKKHEKPLFILNVGETSSEGLPVGVRVFNPPSKVAASSNKRGCRITFQKQGVPSPKLWLSASAIEAGEFPVVGRTTHHSKARGFWYCKNAKEAAKAEAAGATHFLKFIKNTLEFRVHLFSMSKTDERSERGYRSVKLSQKVPRDDKVQHDAIIKNHDSGWVFNFTGGKSDEASIARRAAKKALAAVGLDWGAVDVMVSKETKEAFVLEINSAPCLTDGLANTSEVYASWVLHLTGLREKVLAPPAQILAPTKQPPPKPPAKPRKEILQRVLSRLS